MRGILSFNLIHALQIAPSVKRALSFFLKKDATLPIFFIEDAVRASLELMDAPKESIKIRTSYNLAGVSFSPEDMMEEIPTKLKSKFS